eukprot:862589-Pelagomonas_calceolata.AAC.1
MFKKIGKESAPSLKSYTLDQGALTEVGIELSSPNAGPITLILMQGINAQFCLPMGLVQAEQFREDINPLCKLKAVAIMQGLLYSLGDHFSAVHQQPPSARASCITTFCLKGSGHAACSTPVHYQRSYVTMKQKAATGKEGEDATGTQADVGAESDAEEVEDEDKIKAYKCVLWPPFHLESLFPLLAACKHLVASMAASLALKPLASSLISEAWLLPCGIASLLMARTTVSRVLKAFMAENCRAG